MQTLLLTLSVFISTLGLADTCVNFDEIESDAAFSATCFVDHRSRDFSLNFPTDYVRLPLRMSDSYYVRDFAVFNLGRTTIDRLFHIDYGYGSYCPVTPSDEAFKTETKLIAGLSFDFTSGIHTFEDGERAHIACADTSLESPRRANLSFQLRSKPEFAAAMENEFQNILETLTFKKP